MAKAKAEKQVQLPHNIDAEMAVLGACLCGEHESDIVIASLSVDDFYVPKHQPIFSAISRLRADNRIPDFITVAELMRQEGTLDKVGGSAYLSELMRSYVSIATLDQNIEIARTKAQLRKIAKRCRELIGLALAGNEQAIEQAQALGYDLSMHTVKSQPVNYATVMNEVWDLMEQRHEAKTVITGVPTGFSYLDVMTSGMQPGEYLILAARPSMGKTALAVNIAENAARMGYPGLFISLEMSRVALGQRSLAGASGVNMLKIRTGRCFEDDFAKISYAVGKLSELPLWIDESSRYVAEMRTVIRRLIAEHGIKWVAIDYLQLIADSMPNRNREQEVAMISRQIKAMAKGFSIPVLALSQLSRETTKRSGHRPSLADLRDSGSLEQDADVVMFLHRDDYYDPNSDRKGIADLIIAKQRNGPTGDIELKWDPATTSFKALSRREN